MSDVWTPPDRTEELSVDDGPFAGLKVRVRLDISIGDYLGIYATGGSDMDLLRDWTAKVYAGSNAADGISPADWPRACFHEVHKLWLDLVNPGDGEDADDNAKS